MGATSTSITITRTTIGTCNSLWSRPVEPEIGATSQAGGLTSVACLWAREGPLWGRPLCVPEEFWRADEDDDDEDDGDDKRAYCFCVVK